MEIYIDNIINAKFNFDYEEVAKNVCLAALESEKCPWDCEINITITDNENIREINKETREIDKATDVLSFPNLCFIQPGMFDISKSEMLLAINPENNLVILGEIVLSYEKILSQAEEYGHSIMREYAFLIAHSMLHLCGYDHMIEEDAHVMEEHQRTIMSLVDIKRD